MQTGDAGTSWQSAHGALVTFARGRAEEDFEEGQLLLAAKRAQVHRHQGYGSFGEYIERLFGYAPRVTHDKLRVAEALEHLPELARDLREGKTSFSHVRELTRVATPETEKCWLERARGLHCAAGRKAGIRPPPGCLAGFAGGTVARTARPSLRRFGCDPGDFPRSRREAPARSRRALG